MAAAQRGHGRSTPSDLPTHSLSADFFRPLIEKSNECVVLFSPDGSCPYASPAVKNLLGYTPKQFQEMESTERIHPDDYQTMSDGFEQLISGKKKHLTQEVRLKHKDDSWHWVEAHATNLLSDPNVAAVAVYLRDITQRKQAEASLGYRTALLEAQNEATKDSILVVNMDRKIIFYNKRFEEMWKIPKRVLKDKDALTALDHAGTKVKNQKEFTEKINSVYDNPEAAVHSSEVLFKDGRVFDLYGVPVKDKTGHLYGRTWYFRDITKERRAVNTLKIQNEYLQALQDTAVALSKRLELVPLMNTVLEHGTHLANTQDGYIYLLDEKEEAISVQLGLGIFEDYVGSELKKGEGLAGQVWETGKPLVIEDYDTWPGRSKSFPKYIFHAVVGIPLKSESKIVGVLALSHRERGRFFSRHEVAALERLGELASIALDNARLYERNRKEIQERKLAVAAAESLSEEQARLVELSRSKDEFISLASHQLRTPATGVKQYVGMILSGYAGRVSSHQRQLLQTAYESNERQLKIINDLLKVAHVDSGKVTLHKQLIDVIDLLDDVIDEQADTFKSRGQGAIFKHKVPSLKARIDVDRIRMVLENIIDNASKYSLHGSTVIITVRKVKDCVQIRVKDQGVGIAPKDLDKLFKKFSRIDNPLSTLVGGTGLGLYWAKEIIDLHGGKISVSSTPKKGSTFTIQLPLK
jgi:PAS domain S-box-containing protein